MAKVMLANDYKVKWNDEKILARDQKDYIQIPYPDVTYTQEELDTLMVYVDIANYVKSMESQFVTGEVSLDDWDSYVDTINSMGLESIIAVKQAAYERWNAN